MYQNYKQQKNKVDWNEVIKLILISKGSKNPERVSRSKERIFNIMNAIICKNVDNFFFLVRYIEHPIHSKEDVLSECYFVLDRCIQKFDPKKGNKNTFMFYLHTSLKRHSIRIIEKTYKKNGKIVYTEELFDSYLKHEMGVNFNDLLFKHVGLTKQERLLAALKLKERPIPEIISIMKIDNSRYYKIQNSLKDKLKIIKNGN